MSSASYASGACAPTGAACTSKAPWPTRRERACGRGWPRGSCSRSASFDAPDADALYEGTRAIDWTEWMTPRDDAGGARHVPVEPPHPFAVHRPEDEGRHRRRAARSPRRPAFGRSRRPGRRRHRPHRPRSRDPLPRRRRRLPSRARVARPGGTAPLRENLAAAVVRLSGWDRQRPLLDPMCGSGTLAIEAAAWARRMAPGLSRPRFGFERWASHDDPAKAAMGEQREQARDARLPGRMAPRARQRRRRARARADPRERARRRGRRGRRARRRAGHRPARAARAPW